MTDAADGAVEAATDAADAATQAAAEATQSAADMAEGATDAATDMVEGAADMAADAVEGTTDAATDMAADASDAATDAADAAADAMPAMSMDAMKELLTVDGFDLDKVTAMVEAAPLADDAKATVITALDRAKDSPELLGAVLERVRTLLGM